MGGWQVFGVWWGGLLTCAGSLVGDLDLNVGEAGVVEHVAPGGEGDVVGGTHLLPGVVLAVTGAPLLEGSLNKTQEKVFESTHFNQKSNLFTLCEEMKMSIDPAPTY